MRFKFFNTFYTDFIADIGPIVCALQQVGVEAVGYHGEMDAPWLVHDLLPTIYSISSRSFNPSFEGYISCSLVSPYTLGNRAVICTVISKWHLHCTVPS